MFFYVVYIFPICYSCILIKTKNKDRGWLNPSAAVAEIVQQMETSTYIHSSFVTTDINL